jgi:small subunit ribosomal protein S14
MSFKAKHFSEKERRRLTASFETQLNTYRFLIHNEQLNLSERAILQRRLQQSFRRNRLEVRRKNRCVRTRRAKAVIRFFQLSRICFREAARAGDLLGVKRASW